MIRKRLPVLAVCILFSTAACFACCGNDDAAALAEELADRLTDALAFDGGETQEGESPPANEDAEHPQIIGLSASTDTGGISYNDFFSINLTTDFANLTAIVGAIVRVNDSTKYIKVTTTPSPLKDGSMQLTGTLNRNWKLGDRDFVVKIAMLLDNGEVGNYAPWNLSVLKPAGEAGGCAGSCDSMEVQTFCVSDSTMCDCMNNELTKRSCDEGCEGYGGNCDTAEWGEDYCLCDYPEDEF